MCKMKPTIVRGTRDFGPLESKKRQYIIDILKSKFELFGFMPLETPCLENVQTLTGKYGDEGDQLIFKILNSRLNESEEKETIESEFKKTLQNKYTSKYITEKALRYDLTVPFARYVSMNSNTITYPFKRYQIQPVFRADKPQKGRYREFYQCDVDIIGSNSLLNELELLSIIDKSFSKLMLPVTIKINNRKILNGIAEVIGQKDRLLDITTSIDKLDKIGFDGVLKELISKEIPTDKLSEILLFKGSSIEKILFLREYLKSSEIGIDGVNEIEYLLNNTQSKIIDFDITLARGLDYYTGTIFEVKSNGGGLSSSILGGGRYDNLTNIFGLNGVSGVGVSFGLDRIYDVMESLDLFPSIRESNTNLLLTYFDLDGQTECIKLANRLRNLELPVEVYPDIVKIRKQFEYADKRNIPFVGVIGPNEIKNNTVMLKDMNSGKQEEVDIINLIKSIK